MLSDENLDRILNLIQQFNYHFEIDSLDSDAFFDALKLDKKVRKDILRFVLPTDIGQTKTIDSVTDTQIITSMNRFFNREVL